jgi:hypothetical protein
MHVHMGDSLVPIPRLSMPPDSPLATRSSRHPITEAGFEIIVHNMEVALRAQSAGDPSQGVIRYEGKDKPEGAGLEKACHKIVRESPANETWVVYIDPDSYLPVSVKATANNGDLLERYVFRDVIFDLPELASADAFDPDVRWGPPKGFLQRLARSATDSPSQTTQAR